MPAWCGHISSHWCCFPLTCTYLLKVQMLYTLSYSFYIISASGKPLSCSTVESFIHFYINSLSYSSEIAMLCNSHLVSGLFSSRGKVCVSLSVTAWLQLLHPMPMLYEPDSWPAELQTTMQEPAPLWNSSFLTWILLRRKMHHVHAQKRKLEGSGSTWVPTVRWTCSACFFPSLFSSYISLRV